MRERLGEYRIERELGAGGMGTVFLGVRGGERVALKLVHPHLLTGPSFERRFAREVRLGRAVDHPNVVRTLDSGADGEDRFLVMEFVEGQTLRALLAEMERVPEALCRHVGREIALGLAAIHAAGAVHRDLKPENVLVTPDHRVKIMDLGVAWLAEETVRLSKSGGFVGSVNYAAPEQFAGRGAAIGPATDLHALGVLLYELATGTNPFRDDEMRAVIRRIMLEAPRRAVERNPALSPFFDELLACLLAKEPKDRLPHAAAAAAALAEGEASDWWRARAVEVRRDTKEALRRIRVPRETAVHGRDAELAALRRRYDRAKAGEGSFVLLEGEAGIGKTRLFDEFAGGLSAGGEDFELVLGACLPDVASAAGPLAGAIRERFGREGVAAFAARALVDRPALVPPFVSLLRGEPTPAGVEPLGREALGTAFLAAIRALAADRPLVLFLDDVHLLPAEGRALLAALAHAVPAHAVLLVATARPELPEPWLADIERLGGFVRIPLGRLGPKDLYHLLAESFGSSRLAEDLAGRIGLKSDGNPFFVIEILRGLREQGFLAAGGDGEWLTTRSLKDLDIPSSVLDLVNARVAELATEERDVLDIAACLGFEFDPLLVGEVAGMERIPVLKLLGQVERRHRLVRAAGRRYAFDHHQVQEALHRSLPALLREEYHAAIATVLEARAAAGALPGDTTVLVAEHFLAGNRGERARPHVAPALDHLERADETERAIRLGRAALDAPDLYRGTERARVLLRLAARLDLAGEREGQAAALAEAQALATGGEDDGLRAQVEQALGILDLRLARFDGAREHLTAARELFRRVGDRRGAALVAGNLGVVAYSVGDFETARARYEEELAIARETGDRQTESFAIGNLGNVAWNLGEIETARACAEAQHGIAKEIGDRQGEARSAGNLANALFSLGRTAEARACLEHYLAVSRDIGYRQGEATATSNLGAVANAEGDLRKGREYLLAALALYREIGERQGETITLANLAQTLLAEGRAEEAAERAEQAVRLARETSYVRGEVVALHRLGRARFERGDLEGARAHQERSVELSRGVGYRRGIALATEELGRIHAKAGRSEEAEAALAAAEALATEIDLPVVRVLAAARRARLPGGDLERARRIFAELEERLATTDRADARALLFPEHP